MLATYGAKYRSLKAPRKLQWKPSLGSVQLELTIGDQTLEFNVRARRRRRRQTRARLGAGCNLESGC